MLLIILTINVCIACGVIFVSENDRLLFPHPHTIFPPSVSGETVCTLRVAIQSMYVGRVQQEVNLKLLEDCAMQRQRNDIFRSDQQTMKVSCVIKQFKMPYSFLFFDVFDSDDTFSTRPLSKPSSPPPNYAIGYRFSS